MRRNVSVFEATNLDRLRFDSTGVRTREVASRAAPETCMEEVA
jgi:hypothetical protein